jgi:hypothetical protein
MCLVACSVDKCDLQVDGLRLNLQQGADGQWRWLAGQRAQSTAQRYRRRLFAVTRIDWLFLLNSQQPCNRSSHHSILNVRQSEPAQHGCRQRLDGRLLPDGHTGVALAQWLRRPAKTEAELYLSAPMSDWARCSAQLIPDWQLKTMLGGEFYVFAKGTFNVRWPVHAPDFLVHMHTARNTQRM